MEHVVELRPAVHQVVEHLVTGLPQVLGDAVEDLAVPDLVLDLRRQGQLAFEGRGPRDPGPLGERAHDFGVRVHLDELERRLPVLVRHPVASLDLLAGIDARLELLDVVPVGHCEASLTASCYPHARSLLRRLS